MRCVPCPRALISLVLRGAILNFCGRIRVDLLFGGDGARLSFLHFPIEVRGTFDGTMSSTRTPLIEGDVVFTANHSGWSLTRP